MRPQLDADAAQHQQPEHDHQRQVEAAEARRVEQRKGEVERAAGGYQPDFVAVPHRPDGAQHQAALRVISGNHGADDADAEVEPIEHNVSRQHQRHEYEPYGFHCADLLADQSAASASTLALAGVWLSCWFRKSGPCVTSRQISIRKRMLKTV